MRKIDRKQRLSMLQRIDSTAKSNESMETYFADAMASIFKRILRAKRKFYNNVVSRRKVKVQFEQHADTTGI